MTPFEFWENFSRVFRGVDGENFVLLARVVLIESHGVADGQTDSCDSLDRASA